MKVLYIYLSFLSITQIMYKSIVVALFDERIMLNSFQNRIDLSIN